MKLLFIKSINYLVSDFIIISEFSNGQSILELIDYCSKKVFLIVRLLQVIITDHAR